MRKSLRTVPALAAAGLIAPEREAAIAAVATRYAVAITPTIADLIEAGYAAGPIARQFVPDEAELATAPEERADPIGDDIHAPVAGIVHRYPDRVLLTPSHSCPVYCRFCFRRARVGPHGKSLTAAELARAFDYVHRHNEIFEVIVTGGDPLLLSPRRVRAIVQALSAIDHVGVIRFHTRVPVVEPDRVTDALLQAMATDRGLFVALHVNHAREFTPEAVAAIRRLGAAGVALLGQSVLLAGVNDDPATLADLFRTMVRHRIKPYYLHHPDLAPGTARFRMPVADGLAVVGALRGKISGLCQPTYVLDLPGGHGKVPLGPNYVSEGAEAGEMLITDFRGKAHIYPPPVASGGRDI